MEAIRRAQQGDGAAFERLYLLHCRRVHALCLRMLKNPVDAEELVQEVFLQLFRKIATFRGDSALSTWLYRITVNLMLMRLRKKSPRHVPLEAAIEPDQETNGPAKDVGAPDLRLTGAIDRVILERCTEQLPPGYRTVFILHDIQGYEHNEIAEILGCLTGNSKSQLHKARMRLRELLHEYQRGNTRDLLEVCKQAEAKGDAVHEI